MNSSRPKIRLRPRASSTSSAPLTRPRSSWEISWSMRALPGVGEVVPRGPHGPAEPARPCGARGSAGPPDGSAHALELGRHLVAGGRVLLGPRHGLHHLAEAPLRVP